MARSRVLNSGLGVKVSLSFREVAALKALLNRVDGVTNEEVNLATCELFWSLSDLREDIDANNKGLWPTDFDEFGGKPYPLIDRKES